MRGSRLGGIPPLGDMALTDAKGGYGPVGVLGGFGSKSLKMARNGLTNASKGYSGPPDLILMVYGRLDLWPF